MPSGQPSAFWHPFADMSAVAGPRLRDRVRRRAATSRPRTATTTSMRRRRSGTATSATAGPRSATRSGGRCRASRPTRTSATWPRGPTLDLADRLVRARADGRREGVLHQRRQRRGRHRGQAGAALLGAAGPARAHDDHHADAVVPRHAPGRHLAGGHPGEPRGSRAARRGRRQRSPWDDAEALAALHRRASAPENVAAFFCEPVIGAGGVYPPPAGLPRGGARGLPRARRAVRRRRGHHRIRAHRPDVRVGGTRPGPRAHREGPDVRLPADGRGARRGLASPSRSGRPRACSGATATPTPGTRVRRPPRWRTSTSSSARGWSIAWPRLQLSLTAALVPLRAHACVSDVRSGRRAAGRRADRSRGAGRRSATVMPRLIGGLRVARRADPRAGRRRRADLAAVRHHARRAAALAGGDRRGPRRCRLSASSGRPCGEARRPAARRHLRRGRRVRQPRRSGCSRTCRRTTARRPRPGERYCPPCWP